MRSPAPPPEERAAEVDAPEFPGRVRERDPEALELVVRLYLPQVYRAALGAGLDPHEAEETAQNTLVTFVETAGRFEGRSHVRTWVFGILYRKIAEARRRRKRDLDHDDIDSVFESRFDEHGSWTRPPRPVDEQVGDGEIRTAIADCLQDAPPRQAMAFALREIEGLGTDEIRKILGVTRTNLGVLLMRARNRLRECLESRGIRRGKHA